MPDLQLENRVTILETQMAEVRDDIGEIKEQLKESATKVDVTELKEFFLERDQTFHKRQEHTYDKVWKLAYILIAIFAALITLFFGIKELPLPLGG